MDCDQFQPFKSNVTTAVNSVDDAYVGLQYSSVGLPAGWTMYIHPRGWVYFRNDEYKIVVDEDIRVPSILERVINYYAREEFSSLPDGVEICVLGSTASAFSLVVDHNQCTGGYQVQTSTHAYGMQHISVRKLLRHRRLYWNFVQQHPCHMPTSQRAFREAMDAIKSYYWDNLTIGPPSIVPFSKAECEDLLRVLETRGGTPGQSTASTNAFVAWILREVYSHRTAERYGQLTYQQLNTLRQSVARPAHDASELSTIPRTLLCIIINGPFFGIPQTYLEHVQRASAFRGRLSDLSQTWEKYTEQLTREYSDFILISTVLLSATIGMLSVGNIDQMARVCSIMSAFASLGSITIGVFFVWRHQRNINVSPSHTYAYIHNARSNVLGLSGHAILLSLPPVLLVWSLIGFTAAIMAYTLQTVTDNAMVDGPSTWMIVGLFILVVWCVIAAVYAFTVMWRWHSGMGIIRNIKILFRRRRI